MSMFEQPYKIEIVSVPYLSFRRMFCKKTKHVNGTNSAPVCKIKLETRLKVFYVRNTRCILGWETL